MDVQVGAADAGAQHPDQHVVDADSAPALCSQSPGSACTLTSAFIETPTRTALGRAVRYTDLLVPEVGWSSAQGAYTHLNLGEVEDAAVADGFGHRLEARVARTALGAEQTGVSLFRIHPGRRSPFAHRHTAAEEVYVILAGDEPDASWTTRCCR